MTRRAGEPLGQHHENPHQFSRSSQGAGAGVPDQPVEEGRADDYGTTGIRGNPWRDRGVPGFHGPDAEGQAEAVFLLVMISGGKNRSGLPLKNQRSVSP